LSLGKNFLQEASKKWGVMTAEEKSKYVEEAKV
jgi:hypothetical protein